MSTRTDYLKRLQNPKDIAKMNAARLAEQVRGIVQHWAMTTHRTPAEVARLADVIADFAEQLALEGQ